MDAVLANLEDHNRDAGGWPKLPVEEWSCKDACHLLDIAVNRWGYLGPNCGDAKAILADWDRHELSALGHPPPPDEIANLEHPTGAMCRCPDCEQHDPGSCDGHCCREPDNATGCPCRQPRHDAPDFHLEQVSGWTVAWPATHRANEVMARERPAGIHHAGDALATAGHHSLLADYLNRMHNCATDSLVGSN